MYLLVKAILKNHTLLLAYQQLSLFYLQARNKINVLNKEGCKILANCLLRNYLLQIYNCLHCQSTLIIVTCTVGTSGLLQLHTCYIKFTYMAVGVLFEYTTKVICYQLEFEKIIAGISTECFSHHQVKHSVEMLAKFLLNSSWQQITFFIYAGAN